jgi:hypothetical protein
MAAHWPGSTDDYAAPMNELPKVVFSKTLESADWNDSRVARGDLAQEISAPRREPGGDIVASGGARFVQELSRQGLVDQYRLVINPVRRSTSTNRRRSPHRHGALKFLLGQSLEVCDEAGVGGWRQACVVGNFRPGASSVSGEVKGPLAG